MNIDITVNMTTHNRTTWYASGLFFIRTLIARWTSHTPVMDYHSYLNEIGRNRVPSYIRKQYEKLICALSKGGSTPVYLSGGLPNENTFPAVKATFQLRDGTNLELDEAQMKTALQYEASAGNKELLTWIYELQQQVHNPPTYMNDQHPGKMACLVTCGAQQGMSLVMENLVSEGDIVLVETPAYPGLLALLTPLKPRMIAVEADEQGIIPSKLRNVLSRWNPATLEHPGKDGPKILYCVPTCNNPTGASVTLERKWEIYKLAREYKFLILEDDPYFFLRGKTQIPSFLSMDEDGRVLRTDSMSKVISAGIRVGILTAATPFIEVFKCHIEVSTQTISGLSQQFLLVLLQKWGYGGFYKNAQKMSEFYNNRKEECLAQANKYLKDVAEWNEPAGGMFMWIKLKVKDAKPICDSLVNTRNVFVVPGNTFSIEPEKPCPYIRVSFSNATTEDFARAFQCISELIKDHWREHPYNNNTD